MNAGTEYLFWIMFFAIIAIASFLYEWRQNKKRNIIKRAPLKDSRDSIEYFRKVYGLKDYK